MRTALLSFLCFCLLGGLSASAQTYLENILVTVNGTPSDSIPAVLEVSDNGEGKADFVLKNFCLDMYGQTMPVGNVRVTGVDVAEADGYQTLKTSQTITIEAGDLADVPAESWMGPYLGPVPINLNGQRTADALYCEISIAMGEGPTAMQIHVVVGQPVAASISDIVAPQPAAHEGVYNLQGIRVAQKLHPGLPQGVYIVNGQKRIWK